MGLLAHALCACAALVLLGRGALAAEGSGGRQEFVVEAFTNTKKLRMLDHLALGLPALVAERLGHRAPLRFVGGSEIFARGEGAAAAARWIVAGAFERQPDWKVAVTVEVRRAGSPGEAVARVTRVGPKEAVARTTLEAAVAALAQTPGVALGAAAAEVTAPFARDPYAFVLYGRALTAFQRAGGSAVRLEAAAKVCKRSLVIDPKVPETRRLLALIHLAGGRPGHARAMLTYALDLRPDYVPALRALAALDRTAGLRSARARYARVLELDPDDLDARRAHGELLLEAGLLAEAQKELELVLGRSPEDMRARRQLVLVLASRRAGRELAAELEEIVRLDPENLDARLDLGAAYLGIGMATEAAGAYDEILKRRPRHPAALKLAADLARERGDLKTAAAHYAKLRWLAPQDPRPVFLMAAAHAERGNLDLAQRLYEEAARYPGMLGDAYSNLGALALRRGQPRQALWFLSRAAKRRPHKATIRYNHALALHQVGRDADALNELRSAEHSDPADAGVRFLTGVVALRLGLLEEAMASFRAALELDPGHADARHNLTLLESLRPSSEGSLSFVEADALPLGKTRR